MTINAPLFESTVAKTQAWLKEASTELDADERETYLAVREVLHALRDRVTPEEASDLSAQLPMLMRGFYYEGYNPARTPLSIHTKDELFAHLRERLPDSVGANPERAVHATMRMLGRHVSPGEILDVVDNMPTDLKEVWRDAAQAA